MKSVLIDVRGERFGRLTVLARAHGQRKSAYWVCRCDCGTTTIVIGSKLRNGHTKSCGCLNRERLKSGDAYRSHGMAHSPEYTVWKGMLGRCYNPHTVNYKYYGARGISVCDRWRHDFAAFFADMGPRPSARHSLDRVDNDGPYEPRNCVWALPIQQGRNSRKNRLVTWNGETASLAEWAERIGMPYDTFYHRWSNGWPTAKIFTEPVRARVRTHG